MQALERGLNIHFIDGSSLTVAFPIQSEDKYQRKMMGDEFIKKRVLIIEAEGALHFVPFENIKYMSLFPVPEGAGAGAIQGAKFSG